eukprot:scaffold92818_cov60-Cyclotella_meneghiniana.AAC.1
MFKVGPKCLCRETCRDIVGTLSGHFAYAGKYHEDKCLVLETCRDMSQDIYILLAAPNSP